MDAAELKARGNQEYKDGNFVKAHELYTMAIETLESLQGMGNLELLSKTYWNRSAASISLNRYLPALKDAEKSYTKHPAGNFKACLRAALCNLRIADLAAATTWVERAKQRAPTPNDPAAVQSIKDMEESIARKRHFMSGGRFATDKLSTVYERLEACIEADRSFDDIPFLLYRVRTILLAYVSKTEPDCHAFDVKEGTPDFPNVSPEGMLAAYQHLMLGARGIKHVVEVPIKMHVVALKLSRLGFQPNVPRLVKLMRTPGMEDILLSDLPIVSPEHRALVEDLNYWERMVALGQDAGLKPEVRSPEEEQRLNDAVRVDLAADTFGELSINVLVFLSFMRGPVSKRAFAQLGMLYSSPLYRRAFNTTFWTAFEPFWDNSSFIKGLVAGGGLPGLANDINGPDSVSTPVAQALSSITIDMYRAISLEQVSEAVEYMGRKLLDYKPDSTCECCREKCSKEMARVVAQAYVSIYKAHGEKPFRNAARFSGSIGYYVSRMWPEEKEEKEGSPAKRIYYPNVYHEWMALFYKWGRMHPGKQLVYVYASSLPSERKAVLYAMKRQNLCGNRSCDGRRSKYDENGLRKLRLCKGCRWVAYCSKECQIAAWPEHQDVCGYEDSTEREGHRL